MKRKTTKEILVESFIELSQTTDINKITIHDIVNNCQLSPATFYRYFTDKYDLIAWEYIRHFDERFTTINDNYTWKDYTLETIRYSWNYKIYLKNLLENMKGYQSYFQYVTKQTYQNYINYIEKNYGSQYLSDDIKIYLRYSVYGSVQLVCSWIMDEFEATPEHLTEIICQCVIDPLKRFV